MGSTQFLSTEVSTYLILAEQLKARFGELDDDTLADTLEGISQLPDWFVTPGMGIRSKLNSTDVK